MVPSQNVSFSDKSLCMQFLHGMCPSQTSLFVHSSFEDQSPKTKYHSPWCPTMFLGRVPFSKCSTMHQYPVSSHSITAAHGWAVGQLPECWPFTGCISVKAHHFMVWHLGQTLCGQLLAAGMPNYCIGSASIGCSGCVYLPWAPHWVPISVMGFLSLCLWGEAWALGPQKLKTLRHWIY